MKIIPLPREIRPEPGRFVFTKDLSISYSAEFESLAADFSDFYQRKTGWSTQKGLFSAISFLLDFNLHSEQYKLKVTKEAVVLEATDRAGMFYAWQTLKQMILATPEGLTVECGEINDQPRFAYRGFMLDVARHFFPKQDLLRLIEIMSFHKLNRLHLHLTDDQGWRFESKLFPRLQEIGSKRDGTINSQKISDGIPVEGYYTQPDLKEIAAFAASKFVEIIPEIDLPGHSMALMAAYPEFSHHQEMAVRKSFGISPKILCLGSAGLEEFLTAILSEFISVFHPKIIHLGGDEVPLLEPRSCFKCKKAIQNRHLKNYGKLQTDLINRLSGNLRDQGVRTMVWNDALDSDLDPGIIVQHWKPFSNRQTVSQINKGRKAVISNFFSLYLDYPYAMTPLKKTYDFRPELKGIRHPENILGIESPLWTEWISTREKLEFQMFPRMAAVAELAWSDPVTRDYQDFLDRLPVLLEYYRSLGLNFSAVPKKTLRLCKRIFGTIRWLKDKNCEFLRN